ncbi:MAG: EamA family transporter RarD [Ardenticatenaceae bacterium]
MSEQTRKQGTLAAFAAYFFWGFLPIYWKTVQQVPATELLAHRIVWSLVLLGLVMSVRKQWGWLAETLREPKTLLLYLASACLLATNWVVYIWAVNAGHIVETSLGYFINPLVNVLLGVLFLKERLRRGQVGAVMMAASGVLYLTLSYGVVWWISLTLAFSFGFYALLRKKAPLGALESLSLEIIWLIVPALGYLIYLESANVGSFGHTDPITTSLLILTGLVTAGPLFLFGYGAQRVTLTTLGILQYIAPSLQFIIGVTLYGEAFTTTRMIGFGIIWTALLIYTLEGARHARQRTAKLALSSG